MHAPAASGGRAAPSDFRLGPDCMICIRSPMPLVCCFGSPAANAPRGEARATARVLRGVVSIGHLAWTVTALGRAPRPDLGRRPSLFLQTDSAEEPESVAHVGQEEVRKQRLHHRGCHLLSVGERRCVGQRPHHRSDASRPHSTCFSRDLRMQLGSRVRQGEKIDIVDISGCAFDIGHGHGLCAASFTLAGWPSRPSHKDAVNTFLRIRNLRSHRFAAIVLRRNIPLGR